MSLGAVVLALLIQEKPAAPFGFSALEIYKSSAGAVGPVVADFDGDGRTDFAIANNSGSPRIELFLQKSPEQFAKDAKLPPRYDHLNDLHDDARFSKVLIPHEKEVHGLAVGDLTGDEKPEIVFHGDPTGVEVYERGAEGWKRRQIIRRFRGLQVDDSLAVVDVTSDGKNDLLMLGADEKPNFVLYVFAQQADGLLAATPAAYPTSLEDAQGLTWLPGGKGKGMLVLHRLQTEDGLVVRHVEGGTVGPELRLKIPALRALLPRAGPRGLELVSVSEISGRVQSQRLSSNGEAGAPFGSPAPLTPLPQVAGSVARDLAIGDLNGDGRADLLVSDPVNATLELFAAAATPGSFGAPVGFPTFAGTGSLQAGDFDGDGKAEVLVVSPEEQVIGLARWERDRLGFPKAVPNVRGKPLCAVVTSLGGGSAPDLAYVLLEKTEWHAEVVLDFLTPQRKVFPVALPFVTENPARLLPTDLDRDGDLDLAVVMPSDPFGLIVTHADRFEPLGCEQFGGKNYLSGARAGAYTPAVLPDGRPTLLVAKKNFGRALALVGGKLEVLEQYPGGRTTTIAGVCLRGDQAILMDETRNAARVMARSGADWKPLQEVDLPAKFGLERVVSTGVAGSDVVLVGAKGFLLLAAQGPRLELVSEWGYESDAKNPYFTLPTAGDLNADGHADLAFFDIGNRALEVLTTPQKPGGQPSRALRFEMFEEGRIQRGAAGGVGTLKAVDLTGDGKDDLLVQAHDRILLYVQE